MLLYIRLLFTIGVGLFTSRVILNTLGVKDYGVYNVVGGVVTMFSLFTSSLSSAISRFINVELGGGNIDRLKIVFSTSITIQLVLALLIAIVVEAIGVWFLNTQLNIPEDRMYAANWVLQFSIFTFVINLISVPYNAAIIAHERMDAFAYISILEVALKLMVAYSLFVSPIDKLITYSGLLAVVAITIRFSYSIYCTKHFDECRYKFVFEKNYIRQMIGFAGWNLFGAGAYLFNTQGVNIITNIFFGVTANAARGVANQVEGIVKQFVTNFTTAVNPQIMKSYASGNLEYMHTLVCRGAKFSYLLMLLFVVPFMFETETIMELWLKTYPPEAPLFLRLSMIGTMFDMLGNATANAAWATGKIKRYYIIVGGVGCLVFPVSWICFAFGCPAYTSYLIFIVIYAIVMILKVYIIKGLVEFNPILFYTKVLAKIAPTTVVAFMAPAIAYYFIDESYFRGLFVVFVSLISSILSIYVIGLTSNERKSINRVVLSRIKK